MAAVATNPAVAKKTKIPQSVGKEFMEADKGKKFKGGGEMKESKAMVKKEVSFMKKKGAPKSMIKHEMKEAGMKKMASGGLAAGHKSADGIAMKGKTKGKEVKMALGGAALGALSRAAKQTKASLPGSPMTSKPLSGMLQKAAGRGAVPQAAAKPLARTQQQNAAVKAAYEKQKSPTTIAGGSMPPSRTTLFGGSMKQPTGGGLAAKGAAANALRGLPMKPSATSKPSMSSALAGMGAAVARKMMGKKAGGLAAGHKEADGIAKKGKTRAMQVKMAGGGKTKKYC
jgi:hypothetical protein